MGGASSQTCPLPSGVRAPGGLYVCISEAELGLEGVLLEVLNFRSENRICLKLTGWGEGHLIFKLGQSVLSQASDLRCTRPPVLTRGSPRRHWGAAR